MATLIKTESVSTPGQLTSFTSGTLAQLLPVQRTPPTQVNTPSQLPMSLEPSIEIVEQPKQADLRFRYKCEGRSAGSLLGERSVGERKTYPTIKINNYEGSAAIVVVSCVSTTPPYWPHPHNLVGNDCTNGVCTVKVKSQNQIVFTNIGIQCVTKRDIAGSLKVRQGLQVNPFGATPPVDVANIDLSSVRLCFQVFLPDANRKFTRIVPPVVSSPIHDKKTVHNLVINRLSRQAGCAKGGDEVFLLCEKIAKEDVQVRFFEESDDGICWEAFGQFTPQQDVHHQYAIVFQTPPYKDELITSPARVFIQLRRPSDESTSEPKPFQYFPVDNDPYQINSKRKRLAAEPFDQSMKHIPASVLPLTMKDDEDDDIDNTSQASVSSSVSSASLKATLKRKVERKIQRKEMLNAPVSTTQSSSSSLTQYTSFQTGSTDIDLSNVHAVTEVQSSSSMPVIITSDGSYYALVPAADGQHQLIKLADFGTDEHDMGDLPDIVGGVSKRPQTKSLTTAAVDLSNGD